MKDPTVHALLGLTALRMVIFTGPVPGARWAARLLALLASAGFVTTFELECFGPGQGFKLPGAESLGDGAMVTPNQDWSRDRDESPAYVAEAKTPNGRMITHGVLDDYQNPPLWAPGGRDPTLLDTLVKGTGMPTSVVDIRSYRQVVTWRVERLAALFMPLLAKQLALVSSQITIEILGANSTVPVSPVPLVCASSVCGLWTLQELVHRRQPLYSPTGELIDTVWVDFRLTSSWAKGEPGPWIDMSGAPCPSGATCTAAPGCALFDRSDCSKKCSTATSPVTLSSGQDTQACFKRPAGTMNLMESYKLSQTAPSIPAFLKIFLQASAHSLWLGHASRE